LRYFHVTGVQTCALPIYGFDESDREGFMNFQAKLGAKLVNVGDHLFVTNAKILKRGIENKEANAILVKVNQIGSLSETFDTLNRSEERRLGKECGQLLLM